jgi:peptide/nickel transport system ATP-binding protein
VPEQRTLLDVKRLKVSFTASGASREIVTGISLRVNRGETVAVVGESSSGKSLTARAITRLLPYGIEASGEVDFAGRDLLRLSDREMRRVRGGKVGLVFQDPFTMLNPVMRCGEQIVEALRSGRGRRLPRKTRREEARRRLNEVGIDDPTVADRYPFQLSGGMRQRVAIAAALGGDPELLIADEPSTALDVTTQAEILALLKRVQRSRGMGLILITHNLRVAFSVADRVYVIYAGSILEIATPQEIERDPLHPYTLGLLLSEPAADRRQEQLEAIGGAVASASEVADRCAFEPRCSWAADECRRGKPPLRELAPDRFSACIRTEEIREQMQTTRQRATSELHVATPAKLEAAPLVSVRDLHKVYPGRMGQEVHALRGVSLEIGSNESVGLVGESGSGKTTIGRCLVGLETPTSGSIVIDEVDASDYAKLKKTQRSSLRRTIQIVFQDPYSSLDRMQSVGSALREVLATCGTTGDRAARRVTELLELVGLPAAYAQRRPAALSGGERQRVAIARTLAVEPRVIVCDEPVSALDVSVQAQILNLFRSLREQIGLSYLFITHDLAVVRQVVDRVYVLYRGEIVEEGPADRVLDAPEHPYTARLIASIPKGAG